jgi:sigma-B regulation protein RsbU (phosphoserine phosphatase)
MSAASVAIGLLADIDGDLRVLAERLHRRLFKSLAEEQFITLFLAELDPATGRVRYVNAGHEPPLVVRNGGQLEQLDSTTLPLAMIEDTPLDVSETVLNPGDSVAIFSDGIPEATTDGERFLGLDGVKEALVSHRAESLAALRARIVALVEGFLAGGRASDDVTLLMLRRAAS